MQMPPPVINPFLFVSKEVMKQSIEHIIKEYKGSIFKICLGYASSVEEAEDMLQEAFINIWRGLEKFKGNSSIKTWIYRIAVNTCLLKLRKKKVQTISLEQLDDRWVAYHPGTDQQESFERLHQLIQELPEKDRLIILLYLEELSQKEIADIVGISANYVGVKINRIKQKLTKKIKQDGKSKINLGPGGMSA